MPEPSQDARRIARLFALTPPALLPVAGRLSSEPGFAAEQLRALALQLSTWRDIARRRDCSTVPIPLPLASAAIQSLADAANLLHPST